MHRQGFRVNLLHAGSQAICLLWAFAGDGEQTAGLVKYQKSAVLVNEVKFIHTLATNPFALSLSKGSEGFDKLSPNGYS